MFRDTNANIRVPSFYHTEFKRYAILQFPYFFYIVLLATFFKHVVVIEIFILISLRKMRKTENRVKIIKKIRIEGYKGKQCLHKTPIIKIDLL